MLIPTIKEAVKERMRDIKTVNLKLTSKEFEAVTEHKKPGESWETYVLRLAKGVK